MNNLNISIKGTGTPSFVSGMLQSKLQIDGDQNISAVVSMYRPNVTAGSGIASAGLKFVSADAEDGEAASFVWRKAIDGKYYLIANVMGSDGKSVKMTTPRRKLEVGKVTLRIDKRLMSDNQIKYTFMYNVGPENDVENWKVLDSATAPKIVGLGRVQVFASSQKISSGYLPITARFDSFTLRRETDKGQIQIFLDKFTDTNIGSNWVHTALPAIVDGTTPSPWIDDETVLQIPVASGSRKVGGVDKPKLSFMTINQTMDEDKNSLLAVNLMKPIKTGNEGSATAGVGFDVAAPIGAEDKEGVRIIWTDNQLIGRMIDDKGAMNKVVKTIPAGNDFVDVQILRRKDLYILKYKLQTDSDEIPYRILMQKTSTALGNAGKYYLFTSNTGANNKFPETVGRFDTVRLVYDN